MKTESISTEEAAERERERERERLRQKLVRLDKFYRVRHRHLIQALIRAYEDTP